MKWENEFYNDGTKKSCIINVEWAEAHYFKIKEKKQSISFIKFFEENYKEENNGFLYKVIVKGENVKELCSMKKEKYPLLMANETQSTKEQPDFGIYLCNQSENFCELVEQLKGFLN